MVRRNNLYANVDWASILIWVLLILFGWMNVYSANIMDGDGTIFDLSQRYGKQLVWILFTLVLIPVIFLLDAKFFAFFAYPLYGFILIILIAVVLFGKEINGARSWFVLGGFQFQPSEFAKPFTALALARLISTEGFTLKGTKSLILSGAIIFMPAVLILAQPDLGSTMVYFAFLFVLYREGFSQNTMILGGILVILFVLTLLIDKSIILLAIWLITLLLFMSSTNPKKVLLFLFLPPAIFFGLLFGSNALFSLNLTLYHTSLLSFAFLAILSLIITIVQRKKSFMKVVIGMVVSALFVVSVDYSMNNILKEHQQQRIYVTLGMEDDPQGVGYNVNQSKIAIGSGGFSGKGFLKGTQTKLQFVPEQSTDFIFCTVGEEWGFLGTTTVVLLFVILILRLITLAERQRSHFSRIFGYGLVSVLLIHFLVNIGMTIGLLPVIGIPLPFFSYGGSSLLAFSLFLFIFLKLDSNRMDLLR